MSDAGPMQRRRPGWWATELASVVDPISLDPIRSLKYPPFELRADLGSQHADSDFFDGAVLANYLVSTGNFLHPFSRRELGRDECEALDAYIIEHRLRGGGAAKAHDLRAEYAAGRPPPGSQLASMRATADQILQSLFAGASARRTANAEANIEAAAVSFDGNMSIIDDDQRPSHAAAAPATAAVVTAAAAEVESFPSLQPSAGGLAMPDRRLPGLGGSRYNAVRNAWGVPQAGGSSSSSGWNTVPRRAVAPPASSAVGRPASAGNSLPNGWAVAAAGQAASGTVNSVGRSVVSTTDAPAATASRSKGQKKAAAKQRKAQAAAEGAPAASSAAAEEDAALAAALAASATLAADTAAVREEAAEAGERRVAERRLAGPRVVRPSSMEEAKARHRAVIASLRARLEAGGMNPSEIGDALAQFKSASASFIASAGAGPSAGATVAAVEYLDVFLGLFGKEGSVHLLLELAALMPCAEHAAVFSEALCARWGLPHLPLVEAASPPMGAEIAERPEQQSPQRRRVEPGIDATRAPAVEPPKWSVASGPTYGSGSVTNGPRLTTANVTRSVKRTEYSTSATTKRSVAAPKVAPRVTLAYAAAHQASLQPNASASASMSTAGAASSSGHAASAAAASAAAAAAAQFAEEESFGSAAALRAAMQYSSTATSSGVRKKR